MTRINVVDPAELCDQHLLAEFRELTRIPNAVRRGAIATNKIPLMYTVRTENHPAGGVGHVRFFVDKLQWLRDRYEALTSECRSRGFKITPIWPEEVSISNFPHLWGDYTPTPEARALNRTRIAEQYPSRARYRGCPKELPYELLA